MSDIEPGDFVIIKPGTCVQKFSDDNDNVAYWHNTISTAIVISNSHYHYIETEYSVGALITVLMEDMGIFFVEKDKLMKVNEYCDPSRLFEPYISGY
jgi:hypothetical protein